MLLPETVDFDYWRGMLKQVYSWIRVAIPGLNDPGNTDYQGSRKSCLYDSGIQAMPPSKSNFPNQQCNFDFAFLP